MGVRNGRIFYPGVFWGVRKWRILCFISANSPSGVGGRFFARGVRFFELPGIRKGGTRRAVEVAAVGREQEPGPQHGGVQAALPVAVSPSQARAKSEAVGSR